MLHFFHQGMQAGTSRTLLKTWVHGYLTLHIPETSHLYLSNTGDGCIELPTKGSCSESLKISSSSHVTSSCCVQHCLSEPISQYSVLQPILRLHESDALAMPRKQIVFWILLFGKKSDLCTLSFPFM
jgi:hypothetical protein